LARHLLRRGQGPHEHIAKHGLALHLPRGERAGVGRAARGQNDRRTADCRFEKARHPVDHPNGGGEGRTSGGRHPVTPWGKSTKGKKTRSNKSSNKFILRSRHQKKG